MQNQFAHLVGGLRNHLLQTMANFSAHGGADRSEMSIAAHLTHIDCSEHPRFYWTDVAEFTTRGWDQSLSVLPPYTRTHTRAYTYALWHTSLS